MNDVEIEKYISSGESAYKEINDIFKSQTYENAKLVFGDKLDKMIQILENKINK